MAAMEALSEQEEGYVEVGPSDSDYPLLTLGFRNDHAVLHRFSDEENVYLFRRSHPFEPAVCSIRIMEEIVEFDSIHVLPLKEAWGVIARFFGVGSMGDVGEWVHL